MNCLTFDIFLKQLFVHFRHNKWLEKRANPKTDFSKLAEAIKVCRCSSCHKTLTSEGLQRIHMLARPKPTFRRCRGWKIRRTRSINCCCNQSRPTTYNVEQAMPSTPSKTTPAETLKGEHVEESLKYFFYDVQLQVQLCAPSCQKSDLLFAVIAEDPKRSKDASRSLSLPKNVPNLLVPHLVHFPSKKSIFISRSLIAYRKKFRFMLVESPSPLLIIKALEFCSFRFWGQHRSSRRFLSIYQTKSTGSPASKLFSAGRQSCSRDSSDQLGCLATKHSRELFECLPGWS